MTCPSIFGPVAFPKLQALGAITAEVLPWQNPSQPIFGARRRKGGSGALRCELDMDRCGFRIRLGDAVYSMPYAVFMNIIYIYNIYVYIYIFRYIQWYCKCFVIFCLYLLTFVDICEAFDVEVGMCCYIGCYDLSTFQKQTVRTDLLCKQPRHNQVDLCLHRPIASFPGDKTHTWAGSLYKMAWERIGKNQTTSTHNGTAWKEDRDRTRHHQIPKNAHISIAQAQKAGRIRRASLRHRMLGASHRKSWRKERLKGWKGWK